MVLQSSASRVACWNSTNLAHSVAGEFHQAENHIRNALQHGASPREVLEVILQSTIYAGMPRFIRFVGILESALKEQGRLGEITGSQLPLPATP